MPPLTTLTKPTMSTGRKVGMGALRGDLLIAMILVVIKITQVALGNRDRHRPRCAAPAHPGQPDATQHVWAACHSHATAGGRRALPLCLLGAVWKPTRTRIPIHTTRDQPEPRR
ncbi:hypothetical protein [Streptomyces sp. x-19]|uniref:hypothetical protein n=1 Tax=Streptomyces sp. x-19 TaxID=2789280 RepID=UPI0039806DA1